MKTKEYLWDLVCSLVGEVREQWQKEGDFIVPFEDDLTVDDEFCLLEMLDAAIGVTEKAWELGIINKQWFLVEFSRLHIVKRSVFKDIVKKGGDFNERE